MKDIAVAIVEDNPDLLDDLMLNLSWRGCVLTPFANGAELDAAMQNGCPWNVLVLDLGLPGEDGLSIARRLRQSDPLLGIVMLTARGALADRIQGLTDGADMYLVKPVDMGELAAAIKAVARRLPDSVDAAPVWRLDTKGMCLFSPSGKQIDLTYSETSMIHLLAESPDHFSKTDALVQAIGRNPQAYDSRSLQVMLSRLRHKLGDESPLKAVRARGYIFAAKLDLVRRAEPR
ncbi:MAG: response regulator transcription factor [Rhodoferax sp.]